MVIIILNDQNVYINLSFYLNQGCKEEYHRCIQKMGKEEVKHLKFSMLHELRRF